MGRFLTRDLYQGNYMHEFNRYVYAMANPVMFGDPSGLFAETAAQAKKDIAAKTSIEFGFKKPFIRGAFSAGIGTLVGVSLVATYETVKVMERVIERGGSLTAGQLLNIWKQRWLYHSAGGIDFVTSILAGGIAGIVLQPAFYTSRPVAPKPPNIETYGTVYGAFAGFVQLMVMAAPLGSIALGPRMFEVILRASALFFAVALQELPNIYKAMKNEMDSGELRYEIEEQMFYAILGGIASLPGAPDTKIFRFAVIRKVAPIFVDVGSPVADPYI